jgi:hypothetical protein
MKLLMSCLFGKKNYNFNKKGFDELLIYGYYLIKKGGDLIV